MPKRAAFKDYPITCDTTAEKLWQEILCHLIGQVSVEIIEESAPQSATKLWYRVWFVERKDGSNCADADPKDPY